MAVMMCLHQQGHQKLLTLDQIIEFIAIGDLGCLPFLRRADIIAAFYERDDVAQLVPILVTYLVMEGVLISECVHEDISEQFRINVDDIPTLDTYHATLDRRGSKSPKFSVVSA
jgi:hypothetical protein